MRGIVGIINTDGRPVSRELLWRMTTFMTYRGPDAQKMWIEGHAGFSASQSARPQPALIAVIDKEAERRRADDR